MKNFLIVNFVIVAEINRRFGKSQLAPKQVSTQTVFPFLQSSVSIVEESPHQPRSSHQQQFTQSPNRSQISSQKSPKPGNIPTNFPANHFSIQNRSQFNPQKKIRSPVILKQKITFQTIVFIISMKNNHRIIQIMTARINTTQHI